MQVRSVEAEHRSLERELRSPYVTEMEQYYYRRAKRNRRLDWKRKMLGATWIPRHTRAHMIRHVSLALGRIRRRTRSRRRAVLILVRDPKVERVQVVRGKKVVVTFVRDSRGQVHKLGPDGRFQHFDAYERARLRRKGVKAS